MTALAALAAAARGYGGLERRLFEVLGGWVPSVPEPAVKLLLRTHSFQHAWHAQLWDQLAPRTGPVGGGAEGPGDELVTVLNAVAESESTVERLVGAYQVVLPRLAHAYGDLEAACTVVSDGPLVRALGLMLADDGPAVAAGQSWVEQIAAHSEEEAEAARACRSRLEGLLG